LSARCKCYCGLDSLPVLAAACAVRESFEVADDDLCRAGREVARDPSAKSWIELGHATILPGTRATLIARSARTPGHAACRYLGRRLDRVYFLAFLNP
jgi:hypothetical protein